MFLYTSKEKPLWKDLFLSIHYYFSLSLSLYLSDSLFLKLAIFLTLSPPLSTHLYSHPFVRLAIQ